MKMEKKISILLISFIFVHLSLIVYSNRGKFTEKFDPVYWKDKYEHSQWTLPQSKRVLGDEGLYLYTGYLLTHGANPTLLNAEAPPLAKYLLGLTIRIVGNPYIFGFISSSFALLAFFIFCRILTRSLMISSMATALFAADPLFSDQFSLAMLDSSYLLFLFLLFCVFVVLARTSKKTEALYYAAVGGLVLGLLSEIKFPLLSPVLAVLLLFILLRKRNFKAILLFLVFSTIGYLIPYIPYFMQGHALEDWIRSQKWTINFWVLDYSVEKTFGSAFSTLLSGFGQNLVTRNWDKVMHWNWSWPFVLILGIVGLLKTVGREHKEKIIWIIIFIFTCISLVSVNILPFRTRYLLPIIPFLYLGVVMFTPRLKSPILITTFYIFILAAGWFTSLKIIFPTPEADLKEIVYEWQNGFFQDIYERTTQDTRAKISRDKFHELGLRRYQEAQIDTIAIEQINPEFLRFKNAQSVNLEVTYVTRNLGFFQEHPRLTFIREKGQWRLAWQWNLLADGMTENNHFETTVNYAKRGTIFDSEGKKVAYDFPSFLVLITPSKVDKNKEEEMLNFLENIFKKRLSDFRIHLKYVGNNLPNEQVSIAVIPRKLNQTELNKIKTYPGIFLEDHPERFGKTKDAGTFILSNGKAVECCYLLYSTTSYNGTSGPEQEFNDTLKGVNGGRLTIYDPQGKVVMTVLEVATKDGADVKLPYAVDQEILNKSNE